MRRMRFCMSRMDRHVAVAGLAQAFLEDATRA